ncbi:TnsA-like heteromeric transposase endonuclease subunit [Microbacterium hydrocarbonoxydans]|uniref:TnsA-like heteromeric transposase endonuclease subunit n=1 Tax=Microbacterium hydrocarbonoxydans TaxID=273678 RepID=UPI00203AA7D7|nr:TnsA-like heteromeric transposase endonuclease subunit [Microbacterium hydrocarbonoxydans]MCM3778802.1 TnsA-like heteromeric transposase endonuclease subunit [Microbacterium hydrocarbonoxydans]
MSKNTGIRKSRGDGYDRIEWLDAAGNKHAVRADNPITAAEVIPGERTRRPGKYRGQATYQGRYWCAGIEGHVFHESMAEFTGLMLIDHLYDIVQLFAQPLLLTFADGTFHYPDFLAIEADATRHLVDVHLQTLTTPAHELAFEQTRKLCERLGWRFTVIDQLDDIVRWNLEAMARYHHPRYLPTAQLEKQILRAAARTATFGELREALRTNRPGEHMPAIYNMLWNRHLHIDITKPLTDLTPLSA